MDLQGAVQWQETFRALNNGSFSSCRTPTHPSLDLPKIAKEMQSLEANAKSSGARAVVVLASREPRSLRSVASRLVCLQKREPARLELAPFTPLELAQLTLVEVQMCSHARASHAHGIPHTRHPTRMASHTHGISRAWLPTHMASHTHGIPHTWHPTRMASHTHGIPHTRHSHTHGISHARHLTHMASHVHGIRTRDPVRAARAAAGDDTIGVETLQVNWHDFFPSILITKPAAVVSLSPMTRRRLVDDRR